MAVNQARVDEVVNYLQGSCQDMDDVATEEERNDPEFCRAVDDHIFCCDTCGWWCEIGEQSEAEDDQICDDCFNED